jgi:predicted nuclease with RNAse H fold
MLSLGVDVGGARRGHAAVLLDDSLQAMSLGARLACEALLELVSHHRPDVVAIDSPPRCGLAGGSRACERELLRAGIHSYPTPSDPRRVESHAFFAWMKEGFRLFDALAPSYPLYLGGEIRGKAQEVFPHATAYVLGGGPEPAGRKHAHRRRLLAEAGIDTRSLRTVDEVDAALAAYTGWLALRGEYRAVGDPEEGVIVIPSGTSASLSISGRRRSSYG